MSKPGHLEAQLRGLVERIKELERAERNASKIIGNLIGSTDGLAKCLQTVQDTEQTIIGTQNSIVAAQNETAASVNHIGDGLNQIGVAVAWLMHEQSDDEASVH
jgi:hypothetical protein